MLHSVRRVASAVLISGLLGLSVTTATQAVSLCLNGHPSCLAAAVSFGVPEWNSDLSASTTYFDSTPEATEMPGISEVLIRVVQATNIYLILFGVLALVLLELRELHYLRRLVGRRKA